MVGHIRPFSKQEAAEVLRDEDSLAARPPHRPLVGGGGSPVVKALLAEFSSRRFGR